MALRSSNPVHAEVNKNFLIKWKPYDYTGAKDYPNLVRANGWEKVAGKEKASEHFTKVMEGGKDTYIFKLRLTWEVKFVSI